MGYDANNLKLNEQLYAKVELEQEKYKADLMTRSPAEILEAAAEYAIREDIVASLEFRCVTTPQAMALLKTEDTLGAIYEKWQSIVDTQFMDMVADAIKSKGDDLVQAEGKKEPRGKKSRDRDER